MDAIYRSLKLSEGNIRLVTLKPSRREDGIIRCTLEVCDLNSEIDFIALSYTWGDPQNTQQILVDGVPFQATANLTAYLRRRRKLQDTGEAIHNLPIWIDAICINQRDTQEKNHQLPLMKDIYGRANAVVAWIGTLDEPVLFHGLETKEPEYQTHYEASLRLLVDIGKREDHFDVDFDEDHWINKPPYFEQLCTPILPGPHRDAHLHNYFWNAINEIFHRSYFYRVWTVQETVLARKVHMQLDYIIFDYSAVTSFALWFQRFRKYKPREMDFHYWERFQDPLKQAGIINAVESRMWFSHCARDARRNLSWGTPQNLTYYREMWGAIPFVATLNASDPKDLIYATWGLVDLPLKGDYEKSVSQVYTEFASLGLQYSTDKVFTCSGMARWKAPVKMETTYSRDYGLPSWVPDWNAISSMEIVLNADYNAAHLDQEEDNVLPKAVVEGHRLFQPAISCDVVTAVYPLHGLEEVLELLRKYSSEQTIPTDRLGRPRLQMLLRTLLVDRHPRSFRAFDEDTLGPTLLTFWQAIACRWAGGLKDRFESGVSSAQDISTADDGMLAWLKSQVIVTRPNTEDHLDMKVLLTEERLPSDSCHLTIYLTHLWWVFQHYNIFKTEAGYIGLGGKGCEVGDEIVIPIRFGVPIIVGWQEDHYVHLGACFVLGFMDGEMMDLARREGLQNKIQVYEIR